MSDSCLSLKHHQLSTSKQIHQAKKKNSSSSQAWLAYLYVCSSAAVRLQVIKSALWWDEQYVDKVLRRDDDQDLQRKRACLSLIWVGIAMFLDETDSARCLIEHWRRNLSTVSRYVYIMTSYLI